MDGTSAKRLMITLLKIAALISVMVSAVIFLLAGSGVAEQPTEHPFIEAKEIKSETCLTCRPHKREGKFVHSAVGMGCENCRQATSENGKPTIAPTGAGGELRAMCHEAKKEAAVHGVRPLSAARAACAATAKIIKTLSTEIQRRPPWVKVFGWNAVLPTKAYVSPGPTRLTFAEVSTIIGAP